MEIQYLSFGNITVRLELPEALPTSGRFRDFFGPEKPWDFVLHGSFTDEPIGLPRNAACREYARSVLCMEEGGTATYYRAAPGEFYAVKRQKYGERRASVSIAESVKGRLWTRLILEMLGIEEIAAQKNGVVFHAAFIEWEGRAVLFTGPSGIGKSTQAALWKQFRGTPIINGDKTLLYREGEKLFASGLPFSGSSAFCENRMAALRAIVCLDRCAENAVSPLSPTEALRCLTRSSYILPTCVGSVTQTLIEIAENAPICSLRCTPDERAVASLERYLKGSEAT